MSKGKEVPLPNFLTLVKKDYKAAGWGTQKLSEEEIRKRIATVQSDLALPEDKKRAQDEVAQSVFGLMLYLVSSTSFRRGEEPTEILGRLWETTLRSIRSYDLSRRDSNESNPAFFSTYVAESYKSELFSDRRGSRDINVDTPVTFPPALNKFINRLARARAKLSQENGETPTARELFAELYDNGNYITDGKDALSYSGYTITSEFIDNIMKFMSPGASQQRSGLAPGTREEVRGDLKDNKHTPHEDLLDPEELAAHDEETEAVWKFLDTISERDRQIVIQYYGLGMSVHPDNTVLPRKSRSTRQLASKYGTSHERIAQIVGLYTRSHGKKTNLAYKRLKEMVYGKDEPAS